MCRPWRDERTLYRDARWLVVDKPAGVGCEPRDPGELDSPADLGERLAAHHGLGPLANVLPVPRRASGIALLSSAPRAEAQAALAHGACPCAELTAVVGVDGFRLAASGRLAAGARGEFPYRVLAHNGERALLEVTLGSVRDAGASSRLLEVLAKQQQPVVGDFERGGVAATRLLLHVSKASGQVALQAPLPAAFHSWLQGRAEPSPAEFARVLPDVGLLRWGMRAGNVLRLLDEGAGEIAGLSVELYADYAVLSSSTAEAQALEREVAEYLCQHGVLGVYGKRRVRADLRRQEHAELAPGVPLSGAAAPPELRVQHAGLVYSVHLGGGLATGLFIDQHANWARVRREAAGRSLLNLFCYTGAFTVAAAAGGARETLSVDLSARALAELQQNLEHNALARPEHVGLKADVLAWLPRAQVAARRFDWIILDPPSFGTRARGVLDLSRDYPALVRGALALLAPGGRLLCVAHQRRLAQSALLGSVRQAASGLGRKVKTRLLVGPWDCATLPGVSGTKAVLVQST